MSPLVEHAGKVEREGLPAFFIVDLNSPDPFIPEDFDSLCNAVDSVRAKFVVQDDIMYVFNHHIFHDDFQQRLGEGKVQCAGQIRIERGGEVGVSRSTLSRTISDYSSGLAQSEKLSEKASEDFKHTILAEKLGQYFKIA